MGLHVYQKGPPIGLGWVMQGWVYHTGVGWVMQGWGGSYRGGVGHTGVGWVMQGWGRHARVGWAGSCRGAVGHAVHVGLITQYQKFTNGYKGMCMSGVMFLKE